MSTMMQDTQAGHAEVEAYLKARRDGVGTYAYASLVGLRTFDAVGLHAKVQEGLSYAALERLQRALGMPASVVARILHIPLRTLQRRRKEKRLQPDESDRALRLSRILASALDLFEGDLDATRAWLSTSLTALGGIAPIALAQSEPGAMEVQDLIGRLEHGVFS